MLLPARLKVTSEPLVIITHTPKQVRLVANTHLARKRELAEYAFVAIDIDGPLVTLMYMHEPVYQGVSAHRVINDGGRATIARATYIPRDVAEKLLPEGRYRPVNDAEFGSRVVFNTRESIDAPARPEAGRKFRLPAKTGKQA